MRVMQVMAGAARGGAEAFFERLVIALHRDGLEQRIVIRADAARAARLRAAGLDPLELPFGGPLDLWTRPRLALAASRWQPHLTLSWMNRAAQKMPRTAAVACGRLGGYYDLKYYRACDHLIGNTPGIVRYIVDRGWPSERAHYLPNFVEDRRAAPADRPAYATPEGVPLILALGRYHRNKAFDVLIAALAAVPEAHLWLAGEGPEEPALMALAESRRVITRVRFLPWTSDPAPLFAAADVVAVPSRHEPLGNVVLEAFAQGKPVVAAASSGPAGLIADGESGLLVPVDDPDALAAALQRVTSDPALAARLAAGGRAAYESRFTEAAVVKAYRAFFEKVTA